MDFRRKHCQLIAAEKLVLELQNAVNLYDVKLGQAKDAAAAAAAAAAADQAASDNQLQEAKQSIASLEGSLQELEVKNKTLYEQLMEKSSDLIALQEELAKRSPGINSGGVGGGSGGGGGNGGFGLSNHWMNQLLSLNYAKSIAFQWKQLSDLLPPVVSSQFPPTFKSELW